MSIKTKLKEWKKKVFALNMLEIKLKEHYKQNKIPKKKYKRIRKCLNKLWLNIWDYHPDIDKEENKRFKEYFR